MKRRLTAIFCICLLIFGIVCFEFQAQTEKNKISEVTDKVYEYIISSKDMGDKTIDSIKVEHNRREGLFFSTVAFKDTPRKAIIIVSDYEGHGLYHIESVGN